MVGGSQWHGKGGEKRQGAVERDREKGAKGGRDGKAADIQK